MAFIQSLKQFTLIFFFSWVMVHYFLNESEVVKSFGELMIEENNHANKRVQQARQYFDKNQIAAQAEAQVQQNTQEETSDHAIRSQETVGENKIEAIEQNQNIEHHQEAPIVNESHEAANPNPQSAEQIIDNKPHAETPETKQTKQTQGKKPTSGQQQRQQPKKQTTQQNPQQKQQKQQTGSKIPVKKQPAKKKGEAPLEDQ